MKKATGIENLGKARLSRLRLLFSSSTPGRRSRLSASLAQKTALKRNTTENGIAYSVSTTHDCLKRAGGNDISLTLCTSCYHRHHYILNLSLSHARRVIPFTSAIYINHNAHAGKGPARLATGPTSNAWNWPLVVGGFRRPGGFRRQRKDRRRVPASPCRDFPPWSDALARIFPLNL